MGGWVYYSNRCTARVPKPTVCGRDCGRYRSLGDRCPVLPRRWLKHQPRKPCVCKLDCFLVGLKLVFIRPIESAHFIMATVFFYLGRAEQLCYLWNIRGGSLLCNSLINITSCLVQTNRQTWFCVCKNDTRLKQTKKCEVWMNAETLNEYCECLWRTDDWQGTGKTQHHCLPWTHWDSPLH